MEFFATRAYIKELLAEIRSKSDALEEAARQISDLRKMEQARLDRCEQYAGECKTLRNEIEHLKDKVREQSAADLLLEAMKIQQQVLAGLTPSLSDQERLNLTKQKWQSTLAQQQQNVYYSYSVYPGISNPYIPYAQSL